MNLNFQAATPAMPHSFAWSVKDEATNNDYSHQQESDGKVTSGSYRVAMPDGRTQIVTYRADDNGYVAQVKYEGEAISKYPEYRTSSSSYDNNTPSYSGVETTTASIIPAQKDYKDLEQNARYEWMNKRHLFLNLPTHCL